MNVESWLRVLGLERYAEAFAENGVDPNLLPESTNEDLKDLGVTRLADRKTILKAIEALGPEAGVESPPPPAGEAGELRSEAGAERTFRAKFPKMAILQIYIGGGRQVRI